MSGSGTTACRIRVLINGATRGTREQWSHSGSGYTGWRIFGKTVRHHGC